MYYRLRIAYPACLSVLLAELPNVKYLEEIDALQLWAITPEMIAERYAALPTS